MTSAAPTREATEDLRDRMLQRQVDEHLKTREALGQLRSTTGESRAAGRGSGLLFSTTTAVAQRLNISLQPPHGSELGTNDQAALETIAHASHVRVRRVRLSKGWWDTDCGHLIVWTERGGCPLAVLRTRNGYDVFDPRDQSLKRLDAEMAEGLDTDAATLCRPLPDDVKSVSGLLRFAMSPHKRELLRIVVLSVAGTIVGMFAACATGVLVDHVIPQADRTMALHLLLGLVAAAVGQAILQLAAGVASIRLQTLLTTDSQTAVWDRLLRLPVTFARRFSSGDLTNRAMMVTSISSEVSSSLVRSLIVGGAALLNLGLMSFYSSSLAVIAALIALVWCSVTAALTLVIRRLAVEREVIGGRLFGFVVQVLNGMARVRISSAEQRVFNEWVRRFGQQLNLTSRIQDLENRVRLINMALTPTSTILLFWFAVKETHAFDGPMPAALSVGSFLAFHASFGMFLRGCTLVGGAVGELADSVSKFRLVAPLLSEETENAHGGVGLKTLAGHVRFQNVTFHYDEEGPPVLKNVNLEFRPGSFVALVGPSGSGKSTILKLLLGFETPTSGNVFLDGYDLQRLDMSRVRRKMGVVMQSGHITVGSIQNNIAMGYPATPEQIASAVDDAGLADDVEAMPMGLHTMLSEGGTNLSGGQRQRLMIARALVRNPQIMLFDEATSALDNRTQATVAGSIERRGTTRIVVAHRLSTVRNADQIVVIENGEIMQNGTFEELSATEGAFRSLLKRQSFE